MRQLLLTAAALALLTTTPAIACAPTAFCTGTVSVSGGWVTIDKPAFCRLKVGSYGAKLVLKSCPAGSRCHAQIVGDDDACYATRNVKNFPGKPSWKEED